MSLVKVERLAAVEAADALANLIVQEVEAGEWDSVEAHTHALYEMARAFTVPGRGE